MNAAAQPAGRDHPQADHGPGHGGHVPPCSDPLFRVLPCGMAGRYRDECLGVWCE